MWFIHLNNMFVIPVNKILFAEKAYDYDVEEGEFKKPIVNIYFGLEFCDVLREQMEMSGEEFDEYPFTFHDRYLEVGFGRDFSARDEFFKQFS